MSPEELWRWLPIGFAFTIAIEAPILAAGLSREHPLGRRLLSGAWLTACTYPIIVLVLPAWLDPASERAAYLAVAETFAPAAECAIFALAFHRGSGLPAALRLRDFAAIAVANLASFLGGELLGTLMAR